MHSRRCLLCSHCLDGVLGRDDPFGTETVDCVPVGFRYSPMLGPGSVARGLKHMIILCYLHDILGYFCILKGGEP